jgi:hypothetical protein
MRRDAEFFGSAELDLIYMARRLPEALKLENLLTDAGIDYAVETGPYTAGLLMRRELTGAFFYVAPSSLEAARSVLLEHRYKPYKPE